MNANHEQMCKFTEREDDVYEKVFKRIGRMIKEKGRLPQDNSRVYL